MKKSAILVTLLLFFLLLSSFFLQKELVVSGETMGTKYHIKLLIPLYKSGNNIDEKIAKKLEEINKQFSYFDETSTIGKFNASNNLEAFQIPFELFYLMQIAKEIHAITNKTWDPTIAPLIDLWGFGKNLKNHKIPDDEEIKAAKEKISLDNIEIEARQNADNKETFFMKKTKKDISLNLSSIAKGFGVDVISNLIQGEKIKNFIVEIGGEVYASGVKKKNKKWQVAIQNPRQKKNDNIIYKNLALTNFAIATSGDYQNYFKEKNKRYHHIINPLTGYPAKTNVISASVIAKSATVADALATSLILLGKDDGLKIINQNKDIEAMLIVEEKTGLQNFYSDGFLNFMEK